MEMKQNKPDHKITCNKCGDKLEIKKNSNETYYYCNNARCSNYYQILKYER